MITFVDEIIKIAVGSITIRIIDSLFELTHRKWAGRKFKLRRPHTLSHRFHRDVKIKRPFPEVNG
jgi:hypothetical protein